ncbi:MAG: type IV pilus modification PilV family protein, partial [Planctomycetota bacterium]
MLPTVFQDKRGFSLVEVMISFVILLFVFLALMQTALVSIDSNVRNILRDEAVNFAEERMSALRNTPFDDAVLNAGAAQADATDTREFRDIDLPFTSKKTIPDLNADNKQIAIRITWLWK